MAAPIELIRRVPLFQGLDEKHLKSLARSFSDRTFSAGELIVREGAGGVGFFVIEEGEAVVTVHGQARRTLSPGDYFGEIALIDEGPRTASVEAKTDIRVHALSPWEFRPLVEENASIAWPLLVALARRLREVEHIGA
ncbi:cyclic nucleotide-binding domain-containing protein [Monashia sp. NPDC004114]